MNFASMAKNTLNIVSPAAGAAVTAAQSSSNFDESVTTGDSYSSIIGTIIFFVAMYLAFKCKAPGGGIDPMQILLACCCSPCYMVYRLAVPCS